MVAPAGAFFSEKMYICIFLDIAISLKVCFWSKMTYFDQEWSKIDNFFESGPQMVPRWSPEVPKTDNFMRPAPKTDNFLAAG